jgi:dihydrolipoamide dehydrogenase
VGTKLTIIGAGPGGYVAAVRAAQRGAEVTIIEDREVGGTCLNRGCIPTKTLIATADTLLRVRNAGELGIDTGGDVRYDLGRIRERTNAVVATQVRGVRELLKSWKVNLIEGRGSLLANDVVRAVRQDGMTMDIRSERTIIATGSRPSALPGIVPDGARILTSDDAVLLRSVPKDILIIGAGVIGCEFAFIYRALGAEVTVVEMAARALSSEDEEISAVIEREFKKTKIKLIADTRIEGVTVADGLVAARLADGRELRTEQALLSIGRSMNTGAIGLEVLGIRTGGRGEIAVNDRMETGLPGIYAIGDVTGKIMLAHVASRQGLVAVENALGGNARMDYSAIPAGIFTRPEIGSVGLREHEAAQKGMAVRTGRFPYRALGKAHAMGEITGVVKIISDAATDRVLGMHIVGAHASDLVHEGALAIAAGVTAAQLAGMVHAHPTLAEGIMEAAGDLHGTAIHAHRQKK